MANNAKIQLNIIIGAIITVGVMVFIAGVMFINYIRNIIPLFFIIYAYIRLVELICSSRYVNKLRGIINFSNNYYFSLHKNEFHLGNKNVVVIYDSYNEKLSVLNLKDTSQQFYMHSLSTYRSRDIFQTIAGYINMDTTYDNLLVGFESEGINICKSKKKINIKPYEQKEILLQKNKIIPTVNINYASAEQISKLPGINIVQAKKAIKYREKYAGYKNKEQFFEVLKLKKTIH